MSVDGVLTVEAPLIDGDGSTTPGDVDLQPQRGIGSKWKRAKWAALMTADVGKTPSDGVEGTPGDPDEETAVDGDKDDACTEETPDDAEEGQAGAPSKEKVGVPIFRDELGTRRMYLAVEIGTIYRPRDVLIQVRN